jgi:hypothetical protein
MIIARRHVAKAGAVLPPPARWQKGAVAQSNDETIFALVGVGTANGAGRYGKAIDGTAKR